MLDSNSISRRSARVRSAYHLRTSIYVLGSRFGNPPALRTTALGGSSGLRREDWGGRMDERHPFSARPIASGRWQGRGIRNRATNGASCGGVGTPESEVGLYFSSSPTSYCASCA